MSLAPIGNLTPQHQAPDADAKSIDDARKAAQAFESIFLRQLLGALEKTGGLGGSSQGAAVYKSMMVGALADSASANGGIGLADVVFKAMLPPPLASSAAHGGAATGGAASGAGAGAAGLAAVPLARKALVSAPLQPVPLAPVPGSGSE